MNYGNNYGQQPYGAPPPGQQPYGAPPGGQYGAPPQQQYGAPPQNQYGAPNQGWQQNQYAGPGQYAPQNQGYGQPPAQQNQYGAPPGGQYGAPPQQQYGAPPQGQYGAPQQNQYGAPPQNQYGAPPPQNQYGASAGGQYGAPQPQQQQYGAPPPNPYGQPAFNSSPGGPRFLGVMIPAPPPAPPTTNLPGYNPTFDADRIRKACKGFGTDEKTLIDVLTPLDAFQMDVLARTYEQTVGRSLQKELDKELSSWLGYVLELLSLGPLGGDIWLLNRACKGVGTHEDLLTEILIGRTNEEIYLLKEGYRRVYNKDLVNVVRGELSMKTERMFNMALTGTRDENPNVNHQAVQQDVEALYRAGPGKAGTDEIGICGILLQRSDQHLAAIAQAFPQRHRVTLSQMISSEFSGHMKDALLQVARGAEHDGAGVYRDTELLEASMAGMGTKDERLCYRLVRYHWNRPRFAAIKNQYQGLYRKTLTSRVQGETSGKYERALVGIIEQN